MLAYYNTRYAKASCLESFSWSVEKGGLKLATYSCARDMQVSCPGGIAGAKCETTPAPAAVDGIGQLAVEVNTVSSAALTGKAFHRGERRGRRSPR